MSGIVFHFPDGTVGPGRWDPRSGAVVPDTDQWWYWTPEWQAGERQADAEIAAGRVHTFDSADDLLEWLAEEENE